MDIAACFSDAFKSCDKKGELNCEHFFDDWFREKGTPLFFLFKKNLGVTNIQFAELIALIQVHLRFPTLTRVPHLRFLTVPEFYSALRRIDETFPQREDSKVYGRIGKLYGDLFLQTLVIDPFFSSCALYLPPFLQIDLSKVCGESGYIHSCGRNVLTRKAYKTQPEDLYRALDRVLPKNNEAKKKTVFAIYAREDWPTKSERQPDFVRHGVDDVKIPVSKFFMGDARMLEVIEGLKRRYANKLCVTDPGRLKQEHDDFCREEAVDRSKTFFLIADQEVGGDIKRPGDTRFFICYEQHYINENQFHLFDENKPAWIDHITIPHTLAGAMINITRPWWRTGRVRICDPFSGTGTIWLESRKLPQASAVCSDLHPLASMLARDNLTFFEADTKHLRVYRVIYQQLMSYHPNPESPSFEDEAKNDVSKNYKWAVKLVGKYGGASSDFTAKKRIVTELRGVGPLQRLVFYIVLKAYRRNSPGRRLDDKVWFDLFKQEVFDSLEATKLFIEQRERYKLEQTEQGHLRVGSGQYSKSCCIRLEAKGMASGNVPMSDFDVLDLEPKHNFDVIITDPPYGFNTKEDVYRMAKLYSEFVPILLHALKPDGQLVISLPEWSHTGRRLPAYTYKEFITHHVLVAADSMGLEVIRAPYALPRANTLFRAPFYWESERALRRAILHFRFRRASM